MLFLRVFRKFVIINKNSCSKQEEWNSNLEITSLGGLARKNEILKGEDLMARPYLQITQW